MTYWNSAALYGGWQITDEIFKVKDYDQLANIGTELVTATQGEIASWLPKAILKAERDGNLNVRKAIAAAAGLKHELDSLNVAASVYPDVAVQCNLTALAYKDAYAKFMNTAIYRAVAKYFSGDPPRYSRSQVKRMKEMFARPDTPYDRANLGQFLRRTIGTPYLGKVGSVKYRVRDPFDRRLKRADLLEQRARIGYPIINQIPDVARVPQARAYLTALQAARAAKPPKQPKQPKADLGMSYDPTNFFIPPPPVDEIPPPPPDSLGEEAAAY